MAVTDEAVAALRAYLTARTEKESTDAERGFLTLSRTGHLDGIADLGYGAFAAAARRRFAPPWPSADIVRFVAGFRSSSPGQPLCSALRPPRTSSAQSWPDGRPRSRPGNNEPARSSSCSPRLPLPLTSKS